MMWVSFSDSHHKNAVSVCPMIGNVKFDQFLSDFSNGKRTFSFKLIINICDKILYLSKYFFPNNLSPNSFGTHYGFAESVVAISDFKMGIFCFHCAFAFSAWHFFL